MRPHKRSLEPLAETDGDETLMDNRDDDEARETSAVRSKIQPMKPSDQEIATREACGHYPYRDWCRACVGRTGRADAHKRRQEEQNSLPVASMDYGFFTDGGATPFLVVRGKPSMTIWNVPVQCKGVEDQAAIKETVESLNRLGYPELIVRSDNEPAILSFRDAVIRELKERLVSSNRTSSTKIRFCVSWHGGERHQTGQGASANPW